MNPQGLCNPSPSPENIAAVIVTYYPDPGLPNRIKRVTDQGLLTVIVDNTPDLEAEEVLKKVRARRLIEVQPNGKNLGLAAGLNQGIRRASELGFSWVLTLDQDTVIDSEMVTALIKVYSEYPDPKMIGIIGANARSPISGRLAIRNVGRGQRFLEQKSVMTSGSLLSLGAYNQVGRFRDDFFIEGIDLEYCLRLHKNRYVVLCTSNALMTHAAGTGRELVFFGRRVLVVDHEPWRYYYMMRNLVLIARTYFALEKMWVIGAFANVLKMLIKILCLEKQRRQKLLALGKGLRDGFLAQI